MHSEIEKCQRKRRETISYVSVPTLQPLSEMEIASKCLQGYPQASPHVVDGYDDLRRHSMTARPPTTTLRPTSIPRCGSMATDISITETRHDAQEIHGLSAEQLDNLAVLTKLSRHEDERRSTYEERDLRERRNSTFTIPEASDRVFRPIMKVNLTGTPRADLTSFAFENQFAPPVPSELSNMGSATYFDEILRPPSITIPKHRSRSLPASSPAKLTPSPPSHVKRGSVSIRRHSALSVPATVGTAALPIQPFFKGSGSPRPPSTSRLWTRHHSIQINGTNATKIVTPCSGDVFDVGMSQIGEAPATARGSPRHRRAVALA